MTHVFERVLLHCPYANARHYLPQTLESASAHVISLEQNVLVRYKRGRDPLHFNDPWHVYWTAEGGSPYPEFNGDILVRADERSRTVLELFGDYAPPYRTAQKAPDIIAGARKASTTARALLQRIAADIEERYELELAEKQREAG